MSPVPPGYTHMVLAPGQDTYYLLAVTADSAAAKLLAQVSGVSATKLYIHGSGSKVEVLSQVPLRAMTLRYSLEWDGQQLRAKKIEQSDETEAFFRSRQGLIDSGNLEAVINTPVDGVMYPKSYAEYYEQPKDIVLLAHRKALDAYWNGSIAEALRWTEYSLQEYTFVFGDPLGNPPERGLAREILVPIVNDHAFFLAESGRDAEAEPLLLRVIEVAPDRTVAYINLGDVRWNLGNRTEAKRYYEEYLDLLGAARSQAPPRVLERINQGL